LTYEECQTFAIWVLLPAFTHPHSAECESAELLSLVRGEGEQSLISRAIRGQVIRTQQQVAHQQAPVWYTGWL